MIMTTLIEGLRLYSRPVYVGFMSAVLDKLPPEIFWSYYSR